MLVLPAIVVIALVAMATAALWWVADERAAHDERRGRGDVPRCRGPVAAQSCGDNV